MTCFGSLWPRFWTAGVVGEAVGFVLAASLVEATPGESFRLATVLMLLPRFLL